MQRGALPNYVTGVLSLFLVCPKQWVKISTIDGVGASASAGLGCETASPLLCRPE